MLFSHRFDSAETLSRAEYWLTRHGFEVVKSTEPSHDPSRLTMNVDLSKAAAALALIDSIEGSAATGWNLGGIDREAVFADDRPVLKSGTPIHWDGCEGSGLDDDECRKISEYMFSRWE